MYKLRELAQPLLGGARFILLGPDSIGKNMARELAPVLARVLARDFKVY